MINLRGRVKFPTGGDGPMALSPRAVFTAGFGEIPEPTVQSGWEKIEVHKRFEIGFSNVSLPSLIFETPLLYMKRFFYWLEKNLSVFE